MGVKRGRIVFWGERGYAIMARCNSTQSQIGLFKLLVSLQSVSHRDRIGFNREMRRNLS